jgi:hypothetical protein
VDGDPGPAGLARGLRHHMGAHIGEVHGQPLGDLVLRTGRQQKAGDQPFAAAVDLQQVLAELLHVLGRSGAVHGDLDEGAAQGQRGVQLVGGFGDEAALSVEGAVEALDHRVEGVGEVLHLVVGAAQRDAFVQSTVGGRSAGDPAGGVGDPAQRGRRPAGQYPAASIHSSRSAPGGGMDPRPPTRVRVSCCGPGVGAADGSVPPGAVDCGWACGRTVSVRDTTLVPLPRCRPSSA